MRYSLGTDFTLTNAGGDTDLFQIRPLSNYPIKLVKFILSQTSELAEAAEEQLALQLIRMTATVTDGSGGTTPAIETMDTRQPAAQAVVKTNNATLATTSGNTDIIESFSMNVRATPLERYFADEDRILVREGEVILLRITTAVVDDITFKLTIVFEEI